MRAARLVSLLLLLQTSSRAGARELAARLEVSARTVQRDLEALAAAGVPVRAERGPGGGYSLASGYRTKLGTLTKDEAATLFAAGPVAELGLGHVLARAQLKVLAALPDELREETTRAARLFHLDTPEWFRPPEQAPHLAAIAGAAW